MVVHRSSSVFRLSVRRSPPSLAVRRCPAHWRKSLFPLLVRALADPEPGLAWLRPHVPPSPLSGRLLLDIDYILQWVAPEPPATTLSFWISPATLVFDPAWDLITGIDRTGWGFQPFLDAVRRSDPAERGNYDWTLEGDGITISLGAPGFTQYLRRPPVHCPRHVLSVEEHGGFGFDRFGYAL